MSKEINRLIYDYLEFFVRKFFRTALGIDVFHPYVQYATNFIQQFVDNPERRILVVAMPPRHAKTTIVSICLSAWLLGRNPTLKIMVIAYGEELALLITRGIRSVLKASWYGRAFPTRIAHDKKAAAKFATTEGGEVMAVTLRGGMTGHGADLIIIDDPVEIRDANNERVLSWVKERFENTILNRLNNPSQGKVILVAHCLSVNDLTAHIRRNFDCDVLSLSFLATRSETLRVGDFTWERQKGEILRPDAFTTKEVKRIQAGIR